MAGPTRLKNRAAQNMGGVQNKEIERRNKYTRAYKMRKLERQVKHKVERQWTFPWIS